MFDIKREIGYNQGRMEADLSDELKRIVQLEAALTALAEGNLGDDPWQANYTRIKEFAACALTAAPAPKDWRLVPTNLTDAMIEAYCERVSSLGLSSWANASTIWPAMLAAAPSSTPLHGEQG